MLRGGLRSAPGAVRGKSFVRMGIELAGVGVVLNRGVKLPCIERLEPRAKSHELTRGELFNGFLDVFCGDRS